ncbi:hypothetical protein PV516_19605 [Streptomyces scabiei]|uniref:hypothetical protein n=1 Tax=Streptomyces scabiei TaxID=1930 RepID=UPI0029B1A635|nr:hypothetical protein [Streptomyces scabiei]MDX3165997.1 hypothetical protein [Streptomyces scabiei]
MAEFEETTARTRWVDAITVDDQTAALLRSTGRSGMKFAPCGMLWDAVVIAPLERGLGALDLLGLPQDEGYPVFADRYKQELMVQVELETAHLCAGVQGVRTLALGSWLMVPAGPIGNQHAAWISEPTPFCTRYVDAAGLREAVLAADKRGTPARC